ncbi:MAG: hypothetical protein WCD53_30880 [Microcoleus sp.]
MLQPLQHHYQKIPVVATKHREYQIEVPARTPEGAMDFIQNIGVRESGYYEWVKISCGNLSVVRE